MRLVDANILVYAFTTSFPQHERARAWLDGKLNDGVPLGLPWPSLLGVRPPQPLLHALIASRR